MYYKEDFNKTQKNWEIFWQGGFLGRPIVSITAPKDGAIMPENKYSYVNTVLNIQKGDWYSLLYNYDEIAKNTYFGAESLPYFSCDLSPDIFASFYGGKILAKEGQFTTWVSHIAETARDFIPVMDKRPGSNYDIYKKYMELAAEFAGDKFFISTPDYHTHLDTICSLLKPENLCYDLIDCPEEVERILKIVKDDFSLVFETLYKAGKMNVKGSIGWTPTYCKEKFAVLQCDFSCLISPEMVRKFVIPAVEKEACLVKHSIYHYDGPGALGHFNDILAIKELDCIQWVPGAGQPRTIEWMDLLKKIQKAGKSVLIGDWSAEEILADKELDPAKTIFSLSLSTETECKKFIEKLEKKY